MSVSSNGESITQEIAEQAFADWETDYRANPESFYTKEETQAMEVATVSEARALHFMVLLRARR